MNPLAHSGAHGPHAAPGQSPPLQRTHQPVDIIVPVYRGLAETRLCVDSVLASPVRTAYRLVVINDASPEPELTAWLRRRADEDGRILLLENTENLGFVRTVNRGMVLSEHSDVLLLNSDTEVANDWLDRIQAAAYAHARVASVTPLSTNAAICSYPRFCQQNRLPAGYSTARLDALCARTHPRRVVDVPTGVGFCMYIVRDCLREVGLFDADHFGKGYGEENDFCQRAAAAGWRNLHLLDTFVLHTGAVSFGATKGQREEAAMQVMRRLHPNYDGDVQAYVRADPTLAARLTLDLARIMESGLPVILAVMHNRSGGTMRHVTELAGRLAGRAVFLTLTPAAGKRVLLRRADQAEAFELAFRLPEQAEALLAMLRRLRVQHVHFHHLLGHHPGVREFPQLLGVGYDFTVHDYYSYCTHTSLTGKYGRYTGEPVPGQCGCCPPEMRGPAGFATVREWRAGIASFLGRARHVLAPSEDAARRIAAFAPAARVLVVPHPEVPAAGELPAPTPVPLAPGAPLKIVLLGALSSIKGADVLEDTAREAVRRGAPIEFHLVGYPYRNMKTGPSTHLTVHGKYEDEELPRLLVALRPHLAWFPSQCPETYSYTLSAVLKAGLPVAVADLGAIPERVRGRAWSWIRRWDSTPGQWLDEFIAMRERHFVTGTPPALTESQRACGAGPSLTRADWSYDREYLAGLVPQQPGEAFVAGELEPYLSKDFMTLRQRIFAVLDYLRTHPRLQDLAASIPAHWRQRVSDWLTD